VNSYIPSEGIWTAEERDPKLWAFQPVLHVPSEEINRAIKTVDALIAALRDVLPLGFAYLKNAPSHPDMDKLMQAGALLDELTLTKRT
jgi:hypothetical protein